MNNARCMAFASSRIQKSILKMLKGQLKICKSGATNTRRKHTHRTSLKNSQKRRAIRTEPHLYAEKESTAEYARRLRTAITQELAIDVGASL